MGEIFIVYNGSEFEKVKFDFFKFVVLGQSRRAERDLFKFAAVPEKPLLALCVAGFSGTVWL